MKTPHSFALVANYPKPCRHLAEPDTLLQARNLAEPDTLLQARHLAEPDT